MGPRAAPQLDRLDRYVRRSFLKITDSTSRHRVSYSLEEALRLANLPGEEEGRIYCFRHVRLAGIPADANRRIWLERMQQALSALAAQAVHASDPAAAAASAVYFHHEEEALEMLLRRLLPAEAAPEWFSASVLGVAPDTGRALQIRAILDRLRQPAAPAGASGASAAVLAAVVLAAIGASDPTPLLAAIPDFVARDWLREFDRPKHLSGEPPAVPLPAEFRRVVERSAAHFGWRDPRTVWLAALVVIYLSPSASVSGTAVKAARSTLRILEAAEAQLVRTPRTPRTLEAPTPEGSPPRTARPLVFEEDDESAVAQVFLPVSPSEPAYDSPRAAEPGGATDRTVRPAAPRQPVTTAAPELPTKLPRAAQNPPIFEDAAGSEPSLPAAGIQATAPRPHESPRVADPPRITASPALLGEPTLAAGLYFLLHVLRRLGIAEALEACPSLREAGFVEHILKRIAAHAGVASDDPIPLCLHPEQAQFQLPEEAPPSYAAIWPANFGPSRADSHGVSSFVSTNASKFRPESGRNLPQLRRGGFESEYLLRVWVLAVRRWCWRIGRITVREILRRPGRVWLTRTDLDVTLPLAQAEIRIRRIGLDIDPGWVPWFGRFGRVVRFHYRERDIGESP